MLMIVDSLDRPSLRQVRLTCKELQEHTWQQFAKQHFEEICILPTKGSLDRLEAISKHPRLQHVVDDLEICSSIFNFSYYDDQIVGEDDDYGPADRHCKEDELPFQRPNKSWQSCANESVRWMISGEEDEEEEGFEEQLIRIMENLVLSALTVTDTNPTLDSGSAFTTDKYLLLGYTEILNSTKEDPLQKTQKKRTWDYAGASLHTIVCKKVISALVYSNQCPYSLQLNDIQGAHMNFEHITHGELVEAFERVEFLLLATGSSSLADTNPVPFINFLRLFTKVEILFLEMNYASARVHNRIWHSLCMPCLEALHTPYLGDEHLRGMSSFISRCSTTLRELSTFAAIVDEGGRVSWQLMVKKLESDLTLEELVITLNGRKFEARSKVDVANTLKELYCWISDCPLFE